MIGISSKRHARCELEKKKDKSSSSGPEMDYALVGIFAF